MPQLVDAAPAGPPGELGVLTGGQQLVALPLELPQVLDDHGLGRHVDAERQGFGGEDDLHQSALEQLFHCLLEHREHPRVVGGDAGGKGLPELVEAQRDQVLLGHPRRSHLGELPDALLLARGGQADP